MRKQRTWFVSLTIPKPVDVDEGNAAFLRDLFSRCSTWKPSVDTHSIGCKRMHRNNMYKRTMPHHEHSKPYIYAFHFHVQQFFFYFTICELPFSPCIHFYDLKILSALCCGHRTAVVFGLLYFTNTTLSSI